MSTTSDDPYGRPEATPSAAADPGVPSHDATLFDDPAAPLPPLKPVAASAPVVPAPPAPAAGAAAQAAAAAEQPRAAAPPVRYEPPAAEAPAAAPAAPAPWGAPHDEADIGHLAPPRPAQPVTGIGDDAAAAAPLPAPVDTGRLFRSAGAEGDTAANAIPALPAAESAPAAAPIAAAGMAAAAAALVAPAPTPAPWTPGTPQGFGAVPGWAGTSPVPAPVAAERPNPTAWTPVVPAAAGAAAVPAAAAPAATAIPARPETARPDESAAGTPKPGGGTGLTWTGVSVVLIGVTVMMAFADVIVTHGIGTITGVGLVAATLYCALTVRPADLWAAVVTPPLAYLVALLTAGQFTLPSGGSLLVREGFMVFTGLALNAPWIIGATLLGLVIVLVRRSRARRAGLLPGKASKAAKAEAA